MPQPTGTARPEGASAPLADAAAPVAQPVRRAPRGPASGASRAEATLTADHARNRNRTQSAVTPPGPNAAASKGAAQAQAGLANAQLAPLRAAQASAALPSESELRAEALADPLPGAEPGRSAAASTPLRADLVRSDAGRPDLARHVAAQLANAAPRADGQSEIRLNPEELGRVILRLSTEDGHVMLHVTAERADTGDLMRRHIALLEESYRGLGYDRVEISINGQRADGQSRGWGDGRGQGAPPDQTADSRGESAPALTPSRAGPPASLSTAQGSPRDRVDIRL